MNIFVIGCMHFGHKKIIELCNRPFASVEEMNNILIENWNSVVETYDDVYVLGDFMFLKKDQGHFGQLNGAKHLIIGNHDHSVTRNLGWATTPRDRVEFYYKDKFFVLDHYPIEDWNRRFHGSLHIHAHTHKHEYISAQNRFNVCVEAINYKPVNIEDILEESKKEF